MSPHPPPTGHVLSLATPSQGRLTLDRHPESWRRQLSLALYHEREEHVIHHSEMGRTSQYWVLVPASDPTSADFVCACETFRRPVLVARDGRVSRQMSYAVTAVVTPPEHQRRGYAELMMSLLGEQLAGDGALLERELARGEEWVVPWVGGRDSMMSFLFSYAGDYYSRCGQPGYQIQGVDRTTTWDVASLAPLTANPQGEAPDLVALTALDFGAITAEDSRIFKSELEATASDGTTRFAVEPTAGALDWFVGRAVYAYKAQSLSAPTTWGFSTGSSFVLFTIDPPRPEGWAGELKILRLHSTQPATGARLVRRAIEYAREWHLGLVSAWNVDCAGLSALRQEGHGWSGVTGRREVGLSAVAWYGGPEAVEWIANEQYCWC